MKIFLFYSQKKSYILLFNFPIALLLHVQLLYYYLEYTYLKFLIMYEIY